MSEDPNASDAALPPQSVDAPYKSIGLVRAQGDSSDYSPEALSIKEIDSAIESDKATLTQVVLARYAVLTAVTDKQRSMYNERTGPLLEAYRRRCRYEGFYLRDFHLCSYIPAAVVLRVQTRSVTRFTRLLYSILFNRPGSRSDNIDLVYLPDASATTDAEIEAAIWKSNGLYLEATQRRGGRQSFLIWAVYSLIVYLLSSADAQGKFAVDSERVMKVRSRASNELSKLGEYLKAAAGMEARQDYLLGMFVGVIFLIALVTILFQFTSGRPTIQTVLGVVAAGGLGATVSVMSRLTANRLQVDAGAGTALIRLAGGFRPVVGAIFGLALYVLIEADLFPIKLTVTGSKLTYFYLAVAFLAGFSERFAQDAITKAGAAISPDSSSGEGKPES